MKFEGIEVSEFELRIITAIPDIGFYRSAHLPKSSKNHGVRMGDLLPMIQKGLIVCSGDSAYVSLTDLGRKLKDSQFVSRSHRR